MATKKAFESRAEQELAEYSTYRAKQDIPHDGVFAYRKGHPVPVSNVQKFKYDEMGLVEKLRGDDRVQAEQAAVANSDAEPK